MRILRSRHLCILARQKVRMGSFEEAHVRHKGCAPSPPAAQDAQMLHAHGCAGAASTVIAREGGKSGAKNGGTTTPVRGLNVELPFACGARFAPLLQRRTRQA